MYVLFKENNYQKYINGYHNVYDTPREVRLHIRTQFIFFVFSYHGFDSIIREIYCVFSLKKSRRHNLATCAYRCIFEKN